MATSKNKTVSKKRKPTAYAYSVFVGARNNIFGRKFDYMDDDTLRHCVFSVCGSNGYSIIEVRGGWKNTNGVFIEENSRQVIIVTTDKGMPQRLANMLSATFHQEGILIIKHGPGEFHSYDVSRLKTVPKFKPARTRKKDMHAIVETRNGKTDAEIALEIGYTKEMVTEVRRDFGIKK